MAKLGILVNSDRHLRHVVGLARAALAKGHEVAIFAMDEGVRLMADPALGELAALPRVRLSLCEHSARRCGLDPTALPEAVVRGSQLDHALMEHEADRVLVF